MSLKKEQKNKEDIIGGTLIRTSNSKESMRIVYLPRTQASQVPGVLMIPGYKNSGGQRKFIELAERLAQEGIVSLLFDPRGCGYSAGKQEQISIQSMFFDAQSAYNILANLQQVDRFKICLLGHSLGALIAMKMHLTGVTVQKPLIWLSPAIDQQQLIPRWFDSYQLKVFEEGKDLGTAKGTVSSAYIKEALAGDWMGDVSKVNAPTLIIHGGKDEDVPPSYAHAIYDKLGSEKKRLKVIQRADHKMESDYAKQMVIDETIKFLKEHL